MAPRLAFLLLLAVALVAQTFAAVSNSEWELTSVGAEADGGLISSSASTCNGLVGDCTDEDAGVDILSAEDTRRFLYGRQKYISYGALNRNRVPCNRRGHSYYNCRNSGRANPYRRGCTIITSSRGEELVSLSRNLETNDAPALPHKQKPTE
ncbi:protein RALF-like 22 [Canna indica]|uniref:Protein RALF-like 22 n=1 Tax=Canna indica TaxID=4628 RepID=A0AAQ3KI69_9LILI|nr:protein RALF-like 22 [Canna indica]